VEHLQLIGAIIGLFAYVPLFVSIYNGKKQNFATWLLWSILDIILVSSLILQGGNYLLSLGYTIGAIAITILLISKKFVTWTWFETMITALAIVCMTIWWMSGPQAGTIASSLALAVASIPLQIHAAKHPESMPTLPYAFFLLANILSFIGGISWTIEERFFPGSSIVVTLLMLLLILRKYRRTKVDT
jgi:hypothetical protein